MATDSKKTTSVSIPSVKDMFAAGVQFGHESKRWNPKMKKFIYDTKQGIHIVDISKTHELLAEACAFLEDISSKGDVVFVATKKQAAPIVQDLAVKAGAHFISNRWAGGLLTNFKKVSESLKRLRDLETMFESGVEGRTKYEISLMKKEWAKLNRLYGGIKTLEKMPVAMVVADSKFEKGAVNEAKGLNIPIVGMVDTNTDPDPIQYVIPANDDAISSVKLILNTLAEAVLAGNKGNGVAHHIKDYMKVEVQIIKSKEEVDAKETSAISSPSAPRKVTKVQADAPKKVKKSAVKSSGKGILEKVQEAKESARKASK